VSTSRRSIARACHTVALFLSSLTVLVIPAVAGVIVDRVVNDRDDVCVSPSRGHSLATNAHSLPCRWNESRMYVGRHGPAAAA